MTQQNIWDVVVLGAGPAGATVARQLALKGRQVLLLEKSHSPRFKVCGGCLGGEAIDVLREIGLESLPIKCGGVPIQRMNLASRGSVAEIEIGRRIAVSRQAFDAALVAEAVESGVMFCTHTFGLVQPSTDPESRCVLLRHDGASATVSAKAVVVATGLAPCQPGFRTHSHSKSRIGLGTLLNCDSEFAMPNVLQMACGDAGYVGVAPVENRQIAVAAAIDPAALAAEKSPQELVLRIFKECGMKIEFDLLGAVWRGTSPLTTHTNPLSSRRCIVIGDAAGYVEPFTGEGIGWAMRSAVMACEFLSLALDNWDSGLADRWKKLHDQTFRQSHRRCRLIAQLIRSGIVRRVAVSSLSRVPILARPIVRRLDHPR